MADPSDFAHQPPSQGNAYGPPTNNANPGFDPGDYDWSTDPKTGQTSGAYNPKPRSPAPQPSGAPATRQWRT